MEANYGTRKGTGRGVNRRRFLAGVGAAAGAGLLLACTQRNKGESGTATKGGTLNQSSVGTDAKSFHPYLTTDTASSSYQGYVYGVSLSQYDPKTLQQIPFGATWTVSDDQETF